MSKAVEETDAERPGRTPAWGGGDPRWGWPSGGPADLGSLPQVDGADVLQR